MYSDRCNRKPSRAVLLIWALAAVGCIAVTFHPSASSAFPDGMNEFSLTFREQTCPYNVFGIFALPEEKIPLQVVNPDPGSHYVLTSPHGGVEAVDAGKWVWRAPGRRAFFRLRSSTRKAGPL